MDAAKDLTLPVNGDIVVFFEGVNEVESMVFALDFDTEVINNEVEKDGASYVFEKTWCFSCR